VPLDKAAESDIDGGLLAMFWRPVDFYVDWSEQAIAAMKRMKGARFQNAQYYFKKGISFSTTGIYCPTFRLSHGGVFDQKSSNVFCDVLDHKVLLGILSSTLLRYFAKAFINHGVDAQIGDLPIVLPSAAESVAIVGIVDDIIAHQRIDHGFDYRPKLAKLDHVIADLYALTPVERAEVGSWYHRHYPKLHGEVAEEV
jgi:hypothetical protein